ncbi:hypothetical protein [Streptomyces sp. NPDC007905]
MAQPRPVRRRGPATGTGVALSAGACWSDGWGHSVLVFAQLGSTFND